MTRPTFHSATACSALALATSLAFAAPAAAQVASGSFRGTPSTAFGTVNVTEGPGTTDVEVGSPSAVLDWTPDDTAISNGVPIDFQPFGTTATFHNNPNLMNDFALLNRIIPADASRPIQFNGTVISRLQTVAGQVPGGTVFFYSPGGIIVGATAVFDVGNLGLTSAPPLVDANGNWYTGNQVQFGQAASNSFVDIQGGAQILASAESSYVAVFAPQISQSGTIDVNGQAALVAGEAGTITFSPDGLFDIQVTIGTDASFAIDHDGTTGGSAGSSGAGDNHRVYMVAIPKNQAIQLAIGRGSRIGFDIAGAADTVGNAVVLSAGHNLTGGQVETAAAGGATADLQINDSNAFQTGTGIDFTSAVSGFASGDIFVDVFRQTNFASDASLQAGNTVQVAVGAIPGDSVGALTVGGNLTLSTDRFSPVAGAIGDAGTTLLFVQNDASASVAGNLNLTSTAVLDNDGDGVVTGGASQLLLDTGGRLDVGGDLVVGADAFTDNTPGAPGAVGGSAQVFLFGASTLDVAGVTRVTSYGIAGTNNGIGGSGADGTGGFSAIFISGGASATFNELNVAADGVGGVDAGAGAGDGTGGSAQLSVSDAGSTLTVTQANITGDLSFGQLDMLSAEGIGGAATSAGSTGGAGTGGAVGISGFGGATINLPTDPAGPLVRVIARGTGGAALVDGTTGGFGAGGQLSIALDNSSLTVENLLPSLAGLGGNANASASGTINGGDGQGGNRFFSIANGSTFTGSIVGGQSGGSGGNAFGTGAGGDGSGGSTDFFVDGSTINATGQFIVIGQAAGGNGFIGGNATAGTVNAQISNSTINIADGAEFSFSSNAFGGGDLDGTGSVGGDATGGSVQVTVVDSTITGNGIFGALAVGTGGASGAQGGAGIGGFAGLTIENSSVSVTELGVLADGDGGGLVGNANSAGGRSGDGTGGSAFVILGNATVSANTVDISAEGIAGDVDASGFTGLAGGAGTGGSANLLAEFGGSTVTAGDVRVDSSGHGGTLINGSGAGGDGVGGSADARAINQAGLVFNGLLSVVAEGDGASATDGGIGTGGTAVASAADGAISVNGDLLVDASATGGDGTVTAGSATGGLAVANAVGGSLDVSGSVDATAIGSGGVALGSGSGGAGTGGRAQIGAFLGATPGSVSIGGAVTADASGNGGSGAGGAGGDATGGLAELLAFDGSTLAAGGDASVFANAFVGASTGAGDGGIAIAGQAVIHADGGAIEFALGAAAATTALGGDAEDGAGGDAQGGEVLYLATTGGSITQLDGTRVLSGFSGATGGSTSGLGDGGDAYAGQSVMSATGGAISAAGSVMLVVDTRGGAGVNGGDAIALVTGEAEAGLFSLDGTITVGGSALVLTEAIGGDGRFGGAGGNAASGGAVVDANTDATGLPSRIEVGTLTVGSSATGGDGGSSETDGAGGAGGNATSGAVQVFGTAGNGTLVATGSTSLFSSAQGGFGGFGGDGATGGVGGAGGAAQSDYIQFGTRSGMDTPNNNGGATFADVFAQSTARGGRGGDGGAGSTGQANGGSGGDAISAGGVLLVRGSAVAANDVSITGVGIGGEGGFGGTRGAGGFGAGGSVSLTASERFERTDRASVNVNSVTLNSTGTGGQGSTVGASYYGNNGGLFVGQSDAAIGSFSYTNSGQLAPNYDVTFFETDPVTGEQVEVTEPNTVLPDELSLVDSQVAIGSISMQTPGEFILDLDNSTLDAGDLSLLAGGFVLPDVAPAVPGTISVTNGLSIFVDAGGSILTFANFNTDFGVGFSVDGDFQTGGFTAAGDIFVESLGGSVITGDLQASGDIELDAAQAVALGDATAGGSFGAEAGTTVTAGNLTAGDIVEARAQGDVQLGDLSAGIVNPSSDPEVELSVGIISLAGRVTTGDIAAANRIAMLAGAGAALGDLTATDVLLLMGGDLAAGTIDAGGRVHIADDADAAIGGPLDGDNFDFEALFAAASTPTGGNVLLGSVTAGSFQSSSTGGFSAADITAGGDIFIESTGGGVSTAELAGGDILLSALNGDISTAGITAFGSVLLEALNISTDFIEGGDIGLFAEEDVATADIVGSSVAIAAGGDIATGDITAAAPNLTVASVSQPSAAASATGSIVLGAQNGSIATGALNGAEVVLAAGEGVSAGAIAANSLFVAAGGAASVNGVWEADLIQIGSNDIAIAGSGGLEAPDGTITLISLNPNQAIIGDVANPTSGAYILDNAEFGRISGGSVEIYALDNPSQPIDMLIGDLTITGPSAGSTIENGEGFIEFATGQSEDQIPSGAIRIVGNVGASGFGPANEIDFDTGVFEIDAATGSLRVESTPGVLGGIIHIEADNIHIASGEILERLRDDPLYEGRANDLNRPGEIDRPEGVISALGLQLFPRQTLYIQNTGSATDPAGFLTTVENSDIEPPGFSDPSAPDVDVIINGRFQGDAGEVGGRDAFDLIANNAESTAGFTSTSSANGCVFSTSVCTMVVEEEAPPPVSAAEIEVLTQDSPEEESFEAEEEDEAEQEARAPISPPVVLIDSRPLNPDVDVTDPVSGTGNPALIGASVNETPQGDQP